MLTVHHLNNSRSPRILWLLEELGTPYQLVKYQLLQPILLAELTPASALTQRTKRAGDRGRTGDVHLGNPEVEGARRRVAGCGR